TWHWSTTSLLHRRTDEPQPGGRPGPPDQNGGGSPESQSILPTCLPDQGSIDCPGDPIDWARPPAVVADPGSRTAPPVSSFARLGDSGAGHCGRWLVRVGWVVRAGGSRVSGQYPAEVRGPRRARRAVR